VVLLGLPLNPHCLHCDLAIKTEACSCSDGSYYLGISTSAFTLQGSTDEGRIDAVNQIPGDTDDQTSYRAELGGICGIISVLKALLLAYPHIRTLRLSPIINSLDNASAIKNSCQHSHCTIPDRINHATIYFWTFSTG